MEGFMLGKKGSFVEKVDFEKNGVFSLLTRGDGVEIIHQEIEEGRMFYVYPSENANALEFYYLLSGQVVCELDNKQHTLGPEDYFSARSLKDPIHFTALSKVTLLCVFTEQTFVHISNDISTLMEITKQVELKDRYTYKHSDRVAKYSVKIAKKLKLSKVQLENLTVAAVLHDIGKIHVPIEILNKPGRLTDEEFEIIKKHPVVGAEMIKNSYYKELAPIIEQHHEKLNGTGYPYGLSEDDILLEARIIAVSDTFDAMTEDRAYRKAFKEQIAIDELKRLAGTHYDKEVVGAFEQILREEGRIN
ncbi:HD-GYP domain-containing protein [Paenibacillus sp. BSR1-1]|uniref:HD-GYP domain-containing protein n=1 Tax=Paenibacillus sp. BSR1-1 TaxID=3020845 RepID=UPI0025B027DB|nr:HD-GYP domain-containing protein [Paenibacillus sp. BSR1-1]MDN3017966.1 HD-GYP domain-containing protein [Paenibacillus sp. BSR1-1]